MKFFILLFTSISVSLDSFFCGVLLGLKTTKKFKSVTIIATTVFCLCFLGSNIGFLGSVIFEKYSNLMGGLILSGLAFKKDDTLDNVRLPSLNQVFKISFTESFLIGVSIGVDGLIGCLSLTLIGFNYMLVTICITVVHILLLLCAFNISCLIKIKNAQVVKIIPNIILLSLGVIKLLTV